MKLKKIILSISFTYVLIYLITTVINYGWLGSISESAKYWQADDNVFYFYLFVWLMSFSIGYVAYSGLSAFAAALLTIIGTWTGYNAGIDVTYEHTLHIIVTILAITAIMIDMFNLGLKDSKIINLSLSSIVLFMVLSVVILTINKNSVYWIEILAILIVYNFYWRFIKIRNEETTTKS